MPIKIPNDLPAAAILEKEHIFIMNSDRAYSQDIRPLRLLILNLMPVKQVTETQLLRLLGNTPLQVEVDFIYTESVLCADAHLPGLPDGVLWHLCRGAPQEIRWLYHYRCTGGADAL